MWWFLIKGKPSPENSVVEENIAGAYISAWINFPEIDASKEIANFYIKEQEWEVVSFIKDQWVTSEDYENSDDLQYYEEALSTGSTFYFHQWASDADDIEMDYEATIQ